jgi:ribosomal protein L12E/L44/L45/RPP1/RPP2
LLETNPQVGNLEILILYFLLFKTASNPMFCVIIAEAEVTTFMKAAGISVDKDSLKAFFKVMAGKDVVTLVNDGEKKLVKMPRGGGGGGAAAAGPAAAAAEVKEEKKEEAEDVDMGGLFGDEDDY